MHISFYRGGLVATLAAGPLFLLMLGLAVIVTGAGEAIDVDPGGKMLGPLLPILAASLVIGAFLAVLPVCIGGTVMGWVAARNIGLAHPAIWAMAGGGAMAGGLLPFGAIGDSPVSIALIATGTICALIVRFGTRWSDANPRTADPGRTTGRVR